MRDTILATALMGLAACVPALDETDTDTGTITDTGTGIPAVLQGTWGLTALDCAGGAAAKGRMTVGESMVRLYESRAALGQVTERSESRIRASYTFTGEGQSWNAEMTLEAGDSGARLFRTTSGTTDTPGPLLYTRCG